MKRTASSRSKPKYKRILLKLSGEALGGDAGKRTRRAHAGGDQKKLALLFGPQLEEGQPWRLAAATMARAPTIRPQRS